MGDSLINDLFVSCLLYLHFGVFVIYIVFVIADTRKPRRIIEKTIVFAVLCLISYFLLHTDYIKSRKEVNEKWMIGKTLDEISHRYAGYPSEYAFMDNKSPYVLCTYEIVKYDLWDGIDALYLYYALVDDWGRVSDVKCISYGGDLPLHDYKYEERW